MATPWQTKLSGGLQNNLGYVEKIREKCLDLLP